jgi:hypothetical protein
VGGRGDAGQDRRASNALAPLGHGTYPVRSPEGGLVEDASFACSSVSSRNSICRYTTVSPGLTRAIEEIKG